MPSAGGIITNRQLPFGGERDVTTVIIFGNITIYTSNSPYNTPHELSSFSRHGLSVAFTRFIYQQICRDEALAFDVH